MAPGSKVDRFVFTSTTSLMISQEIRDGKAGGAKEAVWIDESMTPLKPRNIYGVTKLAAEELCRLFNHLHKLPVLVLRTSRFFPEEDDMAHAIAQSGENTKANEFLFRRLSVEDAAEAHVVALAKAQGHRLRHLHRLGADAVPPRGLPRPDRRRPVGRRALLPRLSQALREPRLDDVRHRRPRLRSSKAAKVLGFTCRTNFKEVLDGGLTSSASDASRWRAPARTLVAMNPIRLHPLRRAARSVDPARRRGPGGARASAGPPHRRQEGQGHHRRGLRVQGAARRGGGHRHPLQAARQRQAADRERRAARRHHRLSRLLLRARRLPRSRRWTG